MEQYRSSEIFNYVKYTFYSVDSAALMLKALLKAGSTYNSYALGINAYNSLKDLMSVLPESKLGPTLRRCPESIIYANSYYYLATELDKDEIVKINE